MSLTHNKINLWNLQFTVILTTPRTATNIIKARPANAKWGFTIKSWWRLWYNRKQPNIPIIYINAVSKRNTIHFYHAGLGWWWWYWTDCDMVDCWKWKKLFQIRTIIESCHIINTAWKVSISEEILVCIFPHSDWIQREYSCGSGVKPVKKLVFLHLEDNLIP